MTRTLSVRSVTILALALVFALMALQLPGRRIEAQGNRLNVLVLCSSCVGAGLPQSMQNAGSYLLDQNTGSVWYYPGGIDSAKAAIYIGKLTEVGKPLSK